MRLRIAIAALAVTLAAPWVASCAHHTAPPAPAVTSVKPAPAPSPVPFTGPLPAYP
jgi:hypothetical protein